MLNQYHLRKILNM